MYGHEENFSRPVSASMSTKLETVSPSAPLTTLLPILDRGHVPLVVDDGKYLGLVTRIDLLNYLRRRVK